MFNVAEIISVTGIILFQFQLHAKENTKMMLKSRSRTALLSPVLRMRLLRNHKWRVSLWNYFEMILGKTISVGTSTKTEISLK